MAYGTTVDPLDPSVVYALKPNIAYPGTSAQATADQTRAQTRLGDALGPNVTVTVSGTAIHVANP